MLKMFKSLVAICLLAVCLASQEADSKLFEELRLGKKLGKLSKAQAKGFDELNGLLVDRVPSSGADENLEAASQLLATAKKGSNLEAALEAFAALKSIRDDTNCDRSSLSILEEIDRALDGSARIRNYDGVFRRVESVVNQVSSEHARHCRKVNAEKIETTLKDTDLEGLMFLTDKFYNKHTFGPSDSMCDEIARTPTLYQKDNDLIGKFELNPTGKECIRDRISELASKNKDPLETQLSGRHDERIGKKVANEAALKELHGKYVLQPCRQFVEKVESICAAAIDESVFIPREELDVWKPESLYKHCARYTLCKIFDRHQNQVLAYMHDWSLKH